MFINKVITAELTKSTKSAPTIGTTKYGVGANPNLDESASIFATAFGVAPIQNPQLSDAKTEAS